MQTWFVYFSFSVQPLSTNFGPTLFVYIQLVLDEEDASDRKMANKLISIYFSFFKSSIKKGEIDSKLVKTIFVSWRHDFCPNE